MRQFTITDEQEARVDAWLRETVYPPIVAEQRRTTEAPHQFMIDEWDAGYPYEGAIGGGLTYEFTPTGIGVVEKVRAYDQTLDLTDYGSW